MREHETNTHNFDEDTVYALMMDALDGMLSAAGREQLNQQLAAHPQLAQEWAALQAVDTLFIQSPIISPNIDLTVVTLKRLPNLRIRRWLTGIIYSFVLLSGFIPFALIVWLLGSWGLFAAEPVENAAQLAAAFLNALAQILTSMGDYLGDQPGVIGWIMVMIGSIVLWGGLFRQLVTDPRTA